MVAHEGSLANSLKELSEQSSDRPAVADLVRSFKEISVAHRQTLESRLTAVAGETIPLNADQIEPKRRASIYPVSSALQQTSAILNQAIIGYAMLRSIALRYRDSSLIGEGNTGDIAEQHTKNYVAAVHSVNQTLHNVVLWELDRENESCQCTCPSCGLGICMCAQGPRRTLSDIWAEVGPISNEAGVFVHPPRIGSAASEAGLRDGDVVVAADGQELDSHFTLQGIVSGHQSGEAIELRVRRSSGEHEDVIVVRP
jgi:membrane-associated protease RseP (regulator of RpoE activity)